MSDKISPQEKDVISLLVEDNRLSFVRIRSLANNNFEISDGGRIDLPGGYVVDREIINIEAVANLLKNQLRLRGIKTKKISFAVEDSFFIKGLLDFQSTDEGQIVQNIYSEVKNYPIFSNKTVSLNYQFLKAFKGVKTRAVFAAVPENICKSYFRCAYDADLDLVRIEGFSFAFLRLLQRGTPYSAKENTAFVFIDKDFVHLHICSADNLFATQTTRIGHQKILSEGLDEFMRWVNNSLLSFRTRFAPFTVERLVLASSSSEMLRFANEISKKSDLKKVILFDYSSFMNISDLSFLPLAAVGITNLNVSLNITLDLKPPQTEDIKLIRKDFKTIITLLFLLFFLTLSTKFWFHFRTSWLGGELKKIRVQTLNIKEKYDKALALEAEKKKLFAIMQGEENLRKKIGRKPALTLLQEIKKKVPQNVWLNEITYEKNKEKKREENGQEQIVKLKGASLNEEAILTFFKALSQGQFFKNVNLERTEAEDFDGTRIFRFGMNCLLNEVF